MSILGSNINDIISLVEIDEQERLIIKPMNSSFSMIYRTASEVNWDSEKEFLFSPKPREWTYVQWYEHIIAVVKESGYNLKLSEKTEWKNISIKLKSDIEETYGC